MCVVAAGARLASCRTQSDSTALWMAWVGSGALRPSASPVRSTTPLRRALRTDRATDPTTGDGSSRPSGRAWSWSSPPSGVAELGALDRAEDSYAIMDAEQDATLVTTCVRTSPRMAPELVRVISPIDPELRLQAEGRTPVS